MHLDENLDKIKAYKFPIVLSKSLLWQDFSGYNKMV